MPKCRRLFVCFVSRASHNTYVHRRFSSSTSKSLKAGSPFRWRPTPSTTARKKCCARTSFKSPYCLRIRMAGTRTCGRSRCMARVPLLRRVSTPSSANSLPSTFISSLRSDSGYTHARTHACTLLLRGMLENEGQGKMQHYANWQQQPKGKTGIRTIYEQM